MRRISFYIYMLSVFLLVSLLSSAVLRSARRNTAEENCFSADNGISVEGISEIVLLCDSAADESFQHSLLSAFPQCDLIESFDNYMLVSVSDSSCFEATLSGLRTFPGIAAADPNYILEPADTVSDLSVTPAPDDPFFSASLLQNLNHGIQYYQNSVTPAKEVVIAVADTGIDISHPALSDYIWTNPDEIPDDGIDNDGNGYIDDVHGWDFYHNDSSVYHFRTSEDGTSIHALTEDNDNHGTHVAGIIVSVLRGGNLFQEDTFSVPVKILPLKIHGGEKASGSVANAVKAIKYAVLMDADICNISWGSSSISSSLSTLERAIADSDMLFVSAAGNTGSDNDITPIYPASLRNQNLISVTFVDSNGRLTKKSNYGTNSVDIAAPGFNIYSTIVGGYAHMSGSSMAVPYVSGIAALIYSCSEGLYPSAVRELLLSRAHLLPYDNPDTSKDPDALSVTEKMIVPGVPNLYNSLLSVDTLTPDLTPPELFPYTTYSTNFIRLNLNVSDEGDSGIRVMKYASGTKSADAFRNGTAGSDMKADGIPFAKPGKYTLYASDYAGNESVIHYNLREDSSAPEFSLTIHTSPSGDNYQLMADVTDADSEIACVYIARGELEAADFPTKKSRLLPLYGNHINTRLTAESSYTLYAKDIRGNTSTVVFTLPLQPLTEQESKEDALE